MPPLRVALLQSSGRPGDVAHNLAVLDEAAGRAADAGAVLLLTSELFLSGYASGSAVTALAEPAAGTSSAAVAEIASSRRLSVGYGYPECAGGWTYNSVQLIARDGSRAANYRKTHLYGDYEAAHFTPGDTLVVQARPPGVDLTVGLLICYDVEFPEAVRAHALAGTDLLLVPTALMRPYESVAHTVVPARAWESQLYIGYANRCGAEGDTVFTGLSCLAGPDGAVPCRAGAAEDLLIADVDPELLADSRERNTYLADRRPELYHSGS